MVLRTRAGSVDVRGSEERYGAYRCGDRKRVEEFLGANVVLRFRIAWRDGTTPLPRGAGCHRSGGMRSPHNPISYCEKHHLDETSGTDDISARAHPDRDEQMPG